MLNHVKDTCCFLLIAIIPILGCNQKLNNSNPVFEQLSSEETGINFNNTLSPTEEINTYLFRNFYNGGGVAIGDINNDGYPDIFFTGNQVSNKLYLNKGNFQFEDITSEAGLTSSGIWSTGVTMADVNGDGWLDIYICKSGPPGGERRHNELFINSGDSTFTEQSAEYGINITELSIHASFFDYDRDGDLDMYLLSNPIQSLDDLQMKEGLRDIREPEGGNKLYRNELISERSDNSEPVRQSIGESGASGRITGTNEQSSWFTDITEEAGIYNSKIGFGLGVSVGDVNRDGWPDMYVSNDFFERDYLYINNRDGTFREVLEHRMNEISLSSMGGDIADLNNDGYPEIFISDMLPEKEIRLKSKVYFRSWEEFRAYPEKGYHYQFTRNTLQLNRGPVNVTNKSNRQEETFPSVYFSEVGRMAGVEASDWSWGGLMADFDLDGNRDIFVPNGIYKDLLDQDYITKMSDPDRFRSIISSEEEPIMKIVESMPSNPISNYMFMGSSDLRFTDVTASWGLSDPGFSNGSAYGDLDNDGDLDLVVNNVNMEAFVYRNRVTERYPERAWLQVELEDRPPNTFAVGAQVTAWAGNQRWYVEQQPVRGFQSTVDHRLHLGLGPVQQLDSLVVQWPDGSITTRTNITTNQRLKINYHR